MKKNKQQKKSPWGQIVLGGFKAEFPQPRIPRILGSANSLSSRNSVYPNVRLDVPIAGFNFPIVAGAVAASLALDTTCIDSWAGRFATLFREYAIVGANLEIRLNNTINGAGLVNVFLDEELGTAPTVSDALNRPRVDMLMTQQFTRGAYRITWKPRDLLDLDYVSTSTNFTPVWLKIFAAVAGTFTTSTTTGQVLVTGTLALEFRGYI